MMTTRADIRQPARDRTDLPHWKGGQQPRHFAPRGLTAGVSLGSPKSPQEVANVAEQAIKRLGSNVDAELRRIGRFMDSEGFYKDGILSDTNGKVIVPPGTPGVASWSPVLDYKPPPSDTPDDDFSSSTLDSKWTVVNGGSGTVNTLYNTSSGSIAIYDLSTRTGWLLVQAGKATGGDQKLDMRQDYAIPDGSCIVASLSPALSSNAANNSYQVGIGVNNTDSALESGDYIRLTADCEGDYFKWLAWDGTSLGDHSTVLNPNLLSYLRIMRSGLTYHCYSSLDGSTWSPLGSKTFSSEANNVWLLVHNNADDSGTVPIQAFDWIRLGSNAMDPW